MRHSNSAGSAHSSQPPKQLRRRCRHTRGLHLSAAAEAPPPGGGSPTLRRCLLLPRRLLLLPLPPLLGIPGPLRLPASAAGRLHAEQPAVRPPPTPQGCASAPLGPATSLLPAWASGSHMAPGLRRLPGDTPAPKHRAPLRRAVKRPECSRDGLESRLVHSQHLLKRGWRAPVAISMDAGSSAH